jgi:F-type H+-transporting ATPase subunit delta
MYELSVDHRSQEKVFSELRTLDQAFSSDQSILNFMSSPVVGEDARKAVITKAIDGKGFSKETVDFVMLLARRNRLSIFKDIVHEFEAEIDAANGVCRGVVRSATTLAPAERQRIEQTVEKVLKKKVIMTYHEDRSVIGGLIAQVGSYTFDDTISSHLQRMNEELKRRTV